MLRAGQGAAAARGQHQRCAHRRVRAAHLRPASASRARPGLPLR